MLAASAESAVSTSQCCGWALTEIYIYMHAPAVQHLSLHTHQVPVWHTSGIYATSIRYAQCAVQTYFVNLPAGQAGRDVHNTNVRGHMAIEPVELAMLHESLS